MCVLTRDAAIAVLDGVVCAPVTRTVRGIRSEVRLDRSCGLDAACVVACDSLLTVPVRRLEREPVGRLTLAQRIELDGALRYALDILG